MGLMDSVGFDWSNDLLVQDRNDTPCALPNRHEALEITFFETGENDVIKLISRKNRIKPS